MVFFSLIQGHSEGTSSVAFEVLIINFDVRVYNFVHLQLFHNKYRFAHFQLFNVKCLFSKKHIFCKQKRMAVYGCMSLVSDFKLTQENDAMLSFRHRYIFVVPHPAQEYTKMRIPNKRYQKLTPFVLFELLGVPLLWGTSV